MIAPDDPSASLLDAALRDAILAFVDQRDERNELLTLPHVAALADSTGPVVTWEIFARSLNALEEAVGTDALVDQLPATALQRPSFRLLLEALSTVASPTLFYRFYVSVTLRRSPGARADWLPAPTPSSLRFRFWMEPPQPTPCPVHFQISKRFMQELPVMLLGTQMPAVEVETDGSSGTFTVHLPPSRTLWVRMRNMWNAAFGRDPMSELAYTEQEVARTRSAELRSAVRELDRRVEERTTELRALNHELEEASANKSRHLADMSHELRTPLNAIIGYAEMLAEEERSEQDAEDLGRIEVAARHLLNLVDNVLDLSKIEAGQLDVAREPVALRPLVASVVTGLSPVLEKRGNQVVNDVEPHTAGGDPLRIRQVLANLLGNAAKFTEGGQIRVSTRREGDHVFVDVSDTGSGMDEATLERVFLPYQQASEATDAPFKGTGLGLPIAQELALLMGGELTAASAPGEGSTFSLRLPACDA